MADVAAAWSRCLAEPSDSVGVPARTDGARCQLSPRTAHRTDRHVGGSSWTRPSRSSPVRASATPASTLSRGRPAWPRPPSTTTSPGKPDLFEAALRKVFASITSVVVATRADEEPGTPEALAAVIVGGLGLARREPRVVRAAVPPPARHDHACRHAAARVRGDCTCGGRSTTSHSDRRRPHAVRPSAATPPTPWRRARSSASPS